MEDEKTHYGTVGKFHLNNRLTDTLPYEKNWAAVPGASGCYRRQKDRGNMSGI